MLLAAREYGKEARARIRTSASRSSRAFINRRCTASMPLSSLFSRLADAPISSLDASASILIEH
jgi:hypothetical protein